MLDRQLQLLEGTVMGMGNIFSFLVPILMFVSTLVIMFLPLILGMSYKLTKWKPRGWYFVVLGVVQVCWVISALGTMIGMVLRGE